MNKFIKNKRMMTCFFLLLLGMGLFMGCTAAIPNEVNAADTINPTRPIDTIDPVDPANPLYEVCFRNIVLITGGTFTQTSPNQDSELESFDHTVSDFHLGKFEVTYDLWYTVYQWAITNGYTFANEGREGNDGTVGAFPTLAKYEPVTYINWRDMIVWCNAYSQLVELTPCYTYSALIIKDSRDTNALACDNAVCNWNANGYRLPTEGEWQYAASNKGATSYDYASGLPIIINNYIPYELTEAKFVARISENSGGTTHIIGSTEFPSALTLWDVSGNVFEMCWDRYGNYPITQQIDYRGPGNGTYRIVRGGCFWSTSCQIGYRDYESCDDNYSSTGFRVAKSDIN